MNVDELGELIFNGGVMTGVAVLTSVWVPIANVNYLSAQAMWTGTPTGTFAFQVTNDFEPNVASKVILGPTTLTNPAAFAAGNPAAAAANFGFEFAPLPWRWWRAVYTNSASTGVLYMGTCGKS